MERDVRRAFTDSVSGAYVERFWKIATVELIADAAEAVTLDSSAIAC